MKKYYLAFMTCLLACSFIFPPLTHADSNLSDDQSVFQFLQDAFQAQISLGEELQSMEEINKVLFPYFTEEYSREFLNENLVAENGKYITYGTDFPILYIPYFSYTGETKVIWSQDQIYTFEFFPEQNEGPVSYESHYEGVRLDKADGEWKVAKYLYDDIPAAIIKQAEGEATEPKKMHLTQKAMAKATLQIRLAINPIASFYKYGNGLAAELYK